MQPFIAAGVTTAAVLAVCVQSQAAGAVTAGVPSGTLSATSLCAPPPAPPPRPLPPSPPAPPPPACAVRSVVDFTSALQRCNVTSVAAEGTPCTSCLSALAAPLVAAGVSPTDAAGLQRCFITHALEMLAVGVPLATYSSLTVCPRAAYVQPPRSVPPTIAPPPRPLPMPTKSSAVGLAVASSLMCIASLALLL